MKKLTSTPEERHGFNMFGDTVTPDTGSTHSFHPAYQYVLIIWVIALLLFMSSNADSITAFFK